MIIDEKSDVYEAQTCEYALTESVDAKCINSIEI